MLILREHVSHRQRMYSRSRCSSAAHARWCPGRWTDRRALCSAGLPIRLFIPCLGRRTVRLHLIEAAIAEANQLPLRLRERYRAAPLLSEGPRTVVGTDAAEVNEMVAASVCEPRAALRSKGGFIRERGVGDAREERLVVAPNFMASGRRDFYTAPAGFPSTLLTSEPVIL